MSYQVLARKWRPQRFEEIVGQTAVTRTLQNAIRLGRIAHAYLFSGPRGVGKTTTARILAKALNCRFGPTPTPCLACPACDEIANGSSIDVLEIDAASNRGIDEIRRLREDVRYAPARDRYKIFIIDEVHMLTAEAFNALLKTLEEPPPHVVFILATTEAHKLPATILSRCQQFEFKNISDQLIFERLKFIAEKEGVSISDYALLQIAHSSSGSMRDAQSAFDQAIAFSGKSVKDEDVNALLGLVDQQLLDDAVYAILSRDAAKLLMLVEDLVNRGHDLQNYCRKLITHIRNLLIVKVAGPNGSLMMAPANKHESLRAQAERFSEEELLRLYEQLSKTEMEMKWSSQPRFHLEMGLLKLIQLQRLVALEDLLDRLNSALAEATPAQRHAPTLKPTPPAPSPREIKAKSVEAAAPRHRSEELTRTFLEALRAEKELLYALVSQAEQITFSDDKLEITLPAGVAALVDVKDNIELIRKAAEMVLGRQVTVSITSPPEPSATKGAKGPQAAAPTSDRAMRDPVIRAFIETFPGKVVIEEI